MKKYIWISVIVALLITILLFTNTLALFETNASANSSLEVGKWKIKVNNYDISLAETITLNDFVFSENSHIEDGYFAPGRSASFDVIIDASETDVSVQYELNIDDSALENHPNIIFNITNLDTNESLNTNTYEGIIGVNDQNKTVNLRISLVWNDEVEYDENDTSLIGEELEFLIGADFKQYLGE